MPPDELLRIKDIERREQLHVEEIGEQAYEGSTAITFTLGFFIVVADSVELKTETRVYALVKGFFDNLRGLRASDGIRTRDQQLTKLPLRPG